MKGLIKILFGGFAFLLVVFVLLAVFVLVIFDPDDYQQLMTDAVYEQTGRILIIDGGISIDMLPCCGVEVERVRLGNPEDFPEGDFARVESVRLGMRLWPLLVDQEIVIGDIGLDGLELTLNRREDGSANWDFPAGETTEPVETASGEAMSLPPLFASGIKITDARLTFQDQVSGASYRLDDFDMRTGTVSVGKPVDVEIEFQATDVANEMSLKGDLDLAVALNFDTTMTAIESVNADVAIEFQATDVANEISAQGDLNLAVALNLDTMMVSMENVNADVTVIANEMSVQGDLDLAVALNLETMMVSIENVNADVTVDAAALPGERLALSTQTETIGFDINTGNFAVTNQRASITAVGSTVNINASGKVTDGAPDLSGTLSLDPVSPRQLLRALDQPDIETSDPEALSSIQASANWVLGKELLAIDNLDLRLDDTKMAGSLQINYLDQSGLKFDVVADQLAIDRYLPPEQEPASQAASPGASDKPPEPTEVPVETLRGLDFSGHVRVGRLTMDALLLENLHAEINASGGRVRLDPMTADLYGGQYNGAVTIDTTGETPSVNFKQTVANVQAVGLLTDLADTSNIEGRLNASFTGNGVGRTDAEIIKTLAGDISFNLVDGVYKEVDVWYEIRSARALLKGESGPQKSADPQTPIEVLTITGRIDDGVLRTKTMVAEIPFLRLNGNGLLNTTEENMNFRFQASVHEKPVFPDGEDLAGLQGLMIPLKVTGAVASPSVGVDLGELMKSEAVKKAEEKAKAKAKELLLDKLGLTETESEEGQATEAAPKPKKEDARDLVKKGLRDLFGR
jgi:AsmA protein